MILMLMTATSAWGGDTISVEQPRQLSWLRRTVRGFSYIDTNYVEPQHYNWSLMLQASYTYDSYRLSTTGYDRQSVSFLPQTGVKMGPYIGWRWLILGYTIDLSNINFSSIGAWHGLDFSIYSAQIGADIYYRHTRNNYKIDDVQLGRHVNTEALEGLPFEGINVGISGVNLYYIFNHQRFSYPAAFAQSTCQKISCGSWMAGLGYMRNSIDFDHEQLKKMVDEHCGSQHVELDSALMFNSVRYYNVSASVGYGYNWVFARNWLLSSTLSLALSYKNSRGETAEAGARGFDLNNFNIDGIGRFGVVYNNTRWYAGCSAIIRTYNYRKANFAANNILGDLKLYIGYNFGARGPYKKKKTL